MDILDKIEEMLEEAVSVKQSPYGKSVDSDPAFSKQLQKALTSVADKYKKSSPKDSIGLSARGHGEVRPKTITITGKGGTVAVSLEDMKKDVELALKKAGIKIYGKGVLKGTKDFMFQVEKG